MITPSKLFCHYLCEPAGMNKAYVTYSFAALMTTVAVETAAFYSAPPVPKLFCLG